MPHARLFLLCLLALFLAGGLCESAPADETEEELEAAERLQQPRNLYEGNVNENLDELRRDLEETAQDRQDGQERQIDRETH